MHTSPTLILDTENETPFDQMGLIKEIMKSTVGNIWMCLKYKVSYPVSEIKEVTNSGTI
jgi:hypothetical protein